MANPTTNYGFVLPTSSDLVTDLPADFDIALQGVDTRLKALQPGTTLGDLAYSSATANTNTRLGIGSTGNVLTVAGGVPTWAAPAGGALPAFSAYGSANQTPTVNVWTKVTMNTEVFDTASNFDTTNSRFLPTTAGYYQINGNLDLELTASGRWFLALYKNGTLAHYFAATTTSGDEIMGSSVLMYLNGTTDYVELYARGTAGTPTIYAGATQTYFTGVGVRA
jgi:hypothetical protein